MANASIQCKPVSTFAKQQRGGERKTEPPPSGSRFANAVNMAMGLGTSLEHAVCGRRFSGRSWRPERSELLAVVVSRPRSCPSPWPESSIAPSLVRRLPLLSPSPPLGLAPVQYFCRSPGGGIRARRRPRRRAPAAPPLSPTGGLGGAWVPSDRGYTSAIRWGVPLRLGVSRAFDPDRTLWGSDLIN